jgi:penicillin-insensitive murein endopeptidase
MRGWVALAGLLMPIAAFGTESRCFGSTAAGRLEGGVSLPLSGANFSAYSVAGWTIGRTHVHATVRNILLDAYAALARSAPEKVFVYGETGWKRGGPFKPHKTHQNGLSVDLMVPVLLDGRSVPLPGGLFNRYGYDLEFDQAGRSGRHVIDFAALAELIHQVNLAAAARGVGITRVIFDVPLQRHLWTTPRGAELERKVTFSTRPAWVRHDEHIHIDFAIACAPR